MNFGSFSAACCVAGLMLRSIARCRLIACRRGCGMRLPLRQQRVADVLALLGRHVFEASARARANLLLLLRRQLVPFFQVLANLLPAAPAAAAWNCALFSQEPFLLLRAACPAPARPISAANPPSRARSAGSSRHRRHSRAFRPLLPCALPGARLPFAHSLAVLRRGGLRPQVPAAARSAARIVTKRRIMVVKPSSRWLSVSVRVGLRGLWRCSPEPVPKAHPSSSPHRSSPALPDP